MTILVAGGTGRLGSLVVERLVSRGLDVRVLTRERQRADHLGGDRVSIAIGDVRDRDCLGPATDGVDIIVSAVHGFNDPGRDALTSVDRDGNANLIDAASEAGAGLVLMSTVGACADSPMELFRIKHTAEQRATESGVPTTIVRATAFLELWIEVLRKTAGRSGRPLVFGRGQNAINFVSVIDVAALVDRAVVDRATRGQTLEIGGPANLSFIQLAQAVQTADGRSEKPRHVPAATLRLMANTVGRIKPELGRQAHAALVMDRADLTFDATGIHDLYPDLPSTSCADVLDGNASGSLTTGGPSATAPTL